MPERLGGSETEVSWGRAEPTPRPVKKGNNRAQEKMESDQQAAQVLQEIDSLPARSPDRVNALEKVPGFRVLTRKILIRDEFVLHTNGGDTRRVTSVPCVLQVVREDDERRFIADHKGNVLGWASKDVGEEWNTRLAWRPMSGTASVLYGSLEDAEKAKSGVELAVGSKEFPGVFPVLRTRVRNDQAYLLVSRPVWADVGKSLAWPAWVCVRRTGENACGEIGVISSEREARTYVTSMKTVMQNFAYFEDLQNRHEVGGQLTLARMTALRLLAGQSYGLPRANDGDLMSDLQTRNRSVVFAMRAQLIGKQFATMAG